VSFDQGLHRPVRPCAARLSLQEVSDLGLEMGRVISVGFCAKWE
jgi:hypothetical protein